jgi:hypothetical protein
VFGLLWFGLLLRGRLRRRWLRLRSLLGRSRLLWLRPRLGRRGRRWLGLRLRLWHAWCPLLALLVRGSRRARTFGGTATRVNQMILARREGDHTRGYKYQHLGILLLHVFRRS